MYKQLIVAFLVIFGCTSAQAYRECKRDEEGFTTTDCIEIPGEDPRYTATEEDMKGMVYVSPEQKRKMEEKIFREKLQEEITIRKSQDFRLDDAGALAEILAGKPRRF